MVAGHGALCVDNPKYRGEIEYLFQFGGAEAVCGNQRGSSGSLRRVGRCVQRRELANGIWRRIGLWDGLELDLFEEWRDLNLLGERFVDHVE